MTHRIITRFSVPRRTGTPGEGLHRDPAWLAARFDLFRAYFVPSVSRLGVPAVLLCSSETAATVASETSDLDWIDVVTQDEWKSGWSGGPDEILTRLDSDDAIRSDWTRAIDAAPKGVEVFITKRLLRLDVKSGRVFESSRDTPGPLAAFTGGANPFARNHPELETTTRSHLLDAPYLLRVMHGGNLAKRVDPDEREVDGGVLAGFGVGGG